MVFNSALNTQIASVYILMPFIGFLMTYTVCVLEERLQNYMQIFSASFLTYFVVLWIYSVVTGAALSPLLEISLSGRPIELVLYLSAGTGMVIGTLAAKLDPYRKTSDLITKYAEKS